MKEIKYYSDLPAENAQRLRDAEMRIVEKMFGVKVRHQESDRPTDTLAQIDTRRISPVSIELKQLSQELSIPMIHLDTQRGVRLEFNSGQLTERIVFNKSERTR